MNTSNTARFASISAIVFALVMAATSPVANAAVMESIDNHAAISTLQKQNNAAIEPQSIALLIMGMLGLVAVRRMQKA